MYDHVEAIKEYGGYRSISEVVNKALEKLVNKNSEAVAIKNDLYTFIPFHMKSAVEIHRTFCCLLFSFFHTST